MSIDQLQQQNYSSQVEKIIKLHQKQAEQSYTYFKNTTMGDLQKDLQSIHVQLKKQLGNVCRKLENKVKNNYSHQSLNLKVMKFFLEPFVAKQYENVSKAIHKMKNKIFQYIQEFTSNVLEKNIKQFKDISLFYYENRIKHVFNDWYSVSSRTPLQKAEIVITGLRRPQTSWVVLGVCKRQKQYGPVRKSILNEQFIGNIYLNGTDSLSGNFKLKKDLSENDTFIIENKNRIIYVYKKKFGRNMDEYFVLDDDTDYFFYVAMKGPLIVDFKGQ